MDILNKINIQNKILRAPEFGDDEGGGTSSSSSNVINIGGVEVNKFYLGNSDNVKIYLGDVLLYPQSVSYKLIAQYSDASEYKVECDGSSALTPSEVSGHTTAKSAMTSAVVSDCVQRIDNNAFYGCSAMTSITIDDNVSELGNQAFMGCSGLTSFTFPSGLTKIDGSCFRLANSIKRIEGIPSGVTYLGSGCFADMTGLSAATIPATVTGGSTNLFMRDTNLKEVHFEGTTPPALGADAFKNCTSLQKIYIPSCDSYNAYATNAQFSAYTDLIYAEDDTQCKPYKSKLSYLQKNESHVGEVDLGLPITTNFKVEIKFRYINGGGRQFFGETPQTGSDTNDFRFFWSSSKVYFDFNDKRIEGTRTTYLSTGDTASADQVFEFGNYYFNNITKDKHVRASYTLGASGRNNFCAFRQTGQDYGKIYYIKIYNGSTLVGDFIPVISNDNKYTFYNKITNTICTVNGTLTGA